MSEHVLIDKKLTKKELLEERLNILNMLIETNEEDKMEERIIKFIEINKENEKTNIEYVNGIYKEILDLKSDLVNYDAIKKYNIKDIKELSILKKEETFNRQKCTEIQSLISCEKNTKNKEILHNELRDLHNEQIELRNKIDKLLINTKLIDRLIVVYKINSNKSFLIKYLEILKILQEKKDRLLKIYEDFTSEDFVEELLVKLYEEKIDL